MSTTQAVPSLSVLPRHVAFILDGNRRWAQARSLPVIEGHKKGADQVLAVSQAAFDRGVEYVTLYVFSVENWSRAPHEVQGLMALLHHFLEHKGQVFLDNAITLRVLGCMEGLPLAIRSALKLLIKRSKPHEQTRKTLLLAVNYGARTELVEAVKRYTSKVLSGQEDPQALDWPTLASYLDTDGIPDPDLIIRSSGEQRLSNFLLLQSAYAELYFSPVYWPDFSPADLDAALNAFAQRRRVFGA